MRLYRFHTEDFALSDSGIHLFRNRFNFKTILYEDVKSATIGRTAEIKNAALVLLLGLTMVCFAFYQSRWVIGLFDDPQVYHIYVESIVLPVIPGVLGIYCIYIAIRRGPVLILKAGTRTYRLLLRTIIRNDQAFEMEDYLNAQLGGKLVVATSRR